MTKTFILWVHYDDNSVSISKHDSYNLALSELQEENQYIIDNNLTPIYEWEIS